jgi:uncharacterized membrane protein YsdA (DUF1294 family)
MPVSLSFLAWWGWFLCALLLRFASWFFSTLYEAAKRSAHSTKWERAGERTLASVFLVAAFFCGIVGVLGFVGWVWKFL